MIVRRPFALLRTLTGISAIGGIIIYFGTRSTSGFSACSLARVFVGIANMSRIAIVRLSLGLFGFSLQYIVSIYRLGYAVPMIIGTTRFGTTVNVTYVSKSLVHTLRSSSTDICIGAPVAPS